jgi:hypothetical protein
LYRRKFGPQGVWKTAENIAPTGIRFWKGIQNVWWRCKPIKWQSEELKEEYHLDDGLVDSTTLR